jgi:hypothetical protein
MGGKVGLSHQERRLVENRVLRGIFGPKRDEVVGDWTRLHSEELHNLYALAKIFIRLVKSRRVRWVGHVASMGCMRNSYTILVGRTERKRSLRIRRRQREDSKTGP